MYRLIDLIDTVRYYGKTKDGAINFLRYGYVVLLLVWICKCNTHEVWDNGSYDTHGAQACRFQFVKMSYNVPHHFREILLGFYIHAISPG